MRWRRSTGVEASNVRLPYPVRAERSRSTCAWGTPFDFAQGERGVRRTGPNAPLAPRQALGFFPASDDSTPRIVRISWLDQPGLVSSVRSVRRVVWILSGG